MKHLASGAIFLPVAAMAAGAMIALASATPQPAFACSGPPTYQQIAMSSLVVAGRIVAAEERSAGPDAIYRTFDLQIAVTDGIRGANAGDRITAIANVPGRVPVMCPQFDRDETFVGKFVVAGLFSENSPPEFFRWGTAYIGLDPSSTEYADALRVAHMATGTSPAGSPTLKVRTATGSCVGEVSVRGSHFQSGQRVLLRYPQEPPDGVYRWPTLIADAQGAFVFAFRASTGLCSPSTFIEAYEWREDAQIGGWPLAMVAFTAARTETPGPPDTGNSRPPGDGPSKEPHVFTFAAIGAALLLAAGAARRSARTHRSSLTPDT